MKSPRDTTRPHTCFASTAPGLEALCASELRAHGIAPLRKQEAGGVAWRGDLTSVARANLWLRTASRVIVRLADFRATAFYELELNAKRIAWERFIAPGAQVELRVTCRKSKLYHSDAVAQRFVEAIERRVGRVAAERVESGDDDDDGDDEIAAAAADASAPRQRFVVRFLHDVCMVSVDSSGELLHRRGYRQALGKAPLRETLAAAVLLGAGWTGDTPLVDPMCGSGTIPIEAAMIARRMAPGRARTFAFSSWPEGDASALASLIDRARDGERPRSPVRIVGSDRDAGAVAAARANAERAGVAADVALSVRSVSAIQSDDWSGERGLIACNPPYGVRVGERERLRNLYAQLGNVARGALPGWRLALLSANAQLERQTGVALEERLRTKNGGITVRLVVGEVGGSKPREPSAA